MSHKSIIVVFHGECTDGWTAAWSAWKKFGDNAEYFPAIHGKTKDYPVDGKDAYFLDFCPPADKIPSLAARAHNLLILDHHQSAMDACKNNKFCVFDMDRSGAGMSWDYFHPDTPRPLLVSYVEDRDIWAWKLPHSKTVSSAIGSYDLYDFDLWSSLAERIENNLESVLEEGRAIERANQIQINGCMGNAMTTMFFGYDNVPVVNASGINLSDLLNQLAAPGYFSVAWYQRPDGKFKYSLRSIGDFDVAKLAEKLGGGGHKNASAFVSTSPPWDLTEEPAS